MCNKAATNAGTALPSIDRIGAGIELSYLPICHLSLRPTLSPNPTDRHKGYLLSLTQAKASQRQRLLGRTIGKVVGLWLKAC